MGFFGNIPEGASFFSVPEPANGIIGESLAVNVLRSLQFSYMLMKGFKSTTRALKDHLDVFRDDGVGGSGGRFKWGSAEPAGGGRGIGRIATGRSSGRVGMGRCSTGISTRSGARINRVGPGRRARCTGDNRGTRARGDGGFEGKAGGDGEVADNSENKGIERGIEGQTDDGKSVDLSRATDAGIHEGAAYGGLVPEGSMAGGMAVGGFRVQADSAVVSKGHTGLISRTLSVARLAVVDGISNQLKPMKGFVKSVKMATRVVNGVKTATGVIEKFQAPVGGVLIGVGAANGAVLGFETARLIVKGAKLSKDFVGVWKSTRVHKAAADTSVAGAKAVKERLLNGLKGSDGVLTLVKLTKDFGSGLGDSLQDGFSNWDLVSKGYDMSNNVLKVFEAFLGLKGGGMIGLVGQGFTVLKGAIGGLGTSMKLVKVVVISKKISIALLQGFGVSKTVADAFKAIQDGNQMMKWITFGGRPKEAAGEDLLEIRSLASLKGGADTRTLELHMTCVQQSAADSQVLPPSLLFSLASSLLADCDASDLGESDKDAFTCSSGPPSNIFLLSLPS